MFTTWQAETTGFKSFTQRNITLVSGHSRAANISMQIGEFSQRVVLALPTDLRNPFTLVHATAGVTAPATGISQWESCSTA